MRRSIFEPRWASYAIALLLLLMTCGVYLSRLPAGSHAEAQQARYRVDVNHAGVLEIASLPGLGPATAQRIIDHRNTHGRFAQPQDLQRVHGIGARTVEILGPWIHCGPGVAGVIEPNLLNKNSDPSEGPLLEESSSLPAELMP